MLWIIEADMLEITKKWNQKSVSCNRIIPPTNSSSTPKYVHLQAGPSSLRYVRAEYKCKVPDVSNSRRNIGTLCNFKLRFQNLKVFVLKVQKNYSKMNEYM